MFVWKTLCDVLRNTIFKLWDVFEKAAIQSVHKKFPSLLSETAHTSWIRKDMPKWKDSAPPQGTNLSVSHAENQVSAQYLSELRREVSFSRCSLQSGLTSVPWEDGGTSQESAVAILLGYSQLASGKQLQDQHNELKCCPQRYNQLCSHTVCNAVHPHKGHMLRSVLVDRITCI